MAKQMEKFEKVSSSWSKLGVESRELSERVTRLEGQLEGSEVMQLSNDVMIILLLVYMYMYIDATFY